MRTDTPRTRALLLAKLQADCFALAARLASFRSRRSAASRSQLNMLTRASQHPLPPISDHGQPSEIIRFFGNADQLRSL